MRIDAIELYHVRMPLIAPWRTAYGEDAAAESVLVQMEGAGHVGWGESCPLAAPCYSPEWAGSVFATLAQWMAPAIIGEAIGSGQEMQQALAHFKGNSFAKAALDNAWWDLEARRQGMPLHQLIGANRATVPVGADFGVMDSIDELLAAIGRAVDARFPRIKLKFRPGWDLNMLRAVRQEFPSERFHIDCNSAYRFDDIELLCRLDDFHLEMIEQPLAYDDLIDHARLQSMIRTPVCLDESISSLERAEQALDLGSCRYVNIKPGRVGGLTTAIAIHDACQAAGVPCWVGGMLESAVGSRLCVALAMLDNFTYPADIFPSTRFYLKDLGAPAIELTTGPEGVPHVRASDEPGVGAVPDPRRLEAMTMQRVRIGPGSAS